VAVLGRDVFDGGGEEAGGGEDLEIAVGPPVAAGAVDNPLRLFDPGDFLQRERGAQQVLRQLLTAGGAVDGPIAGVEAESAVLPVQELAGFLVAEEFFADEGRDEAVAEELMKGRPTALHPCGARHSLREFLSKTPTGLRRFSARGSRDSTGISWKRPSRS